MATENTAIQEVRSVIDGWADGIRSKDSARVVSHGTGDFVQFSLSPPLVGGSADQAGLTEWFSTWRGRIGLEFRDLRVTAGDDVAFAHGLAHLTGTRTDGENSDVWYRQTLCLRRVGGVWKITHAHESVPFYMDGSYRAAIDLKP